jgi:hypothetical protein
MADNNKTLGVGKTVYLNNDESFDSVRMPSGSNGLEQPLPASSSTVRASSQSPARPVRATGQSSSVVRAGQQPQQPQSQTQQRPEAAQEPNADQRRQFLRASKMPVKVVEDQVQEAPSTEPNTQFLRASTKPIVPGPQVVEKDQEIARAPQETGEEESQESPADETQEADAARLSRVMEMLSKSREGVSETKEVPEEEEGEDMPEQIIPEKETVYTGEVKSQPAKPADKKKPKFIDLNKLTVVSKTEIDKERDLRQALYNNKAAFQIVAAQSGYVAKVAPLVHKDLVNILYSNLSAYEQRKSVYKTIHEKVFETSVGKMDFDAWLKNTTVEDMETFYYGVYSSTFPNEGTFRFACTKCGKDHDYKVNHANLIKTTDRDHMKRLIDEVSRNSTSTEKMKEYSLIGKNQAIQASETGLVFELRTPSLLDALEILRTVPEKNIEKDVATLTNMLYVSRVLIPSKDGSGYAEESSRTSVLRIIDNLPIDDANELQAAVYDRVDENRISYSIKNIKCVDCSHEEKDIPISIENILFTLIFEKAQ